MRVDIANVGWRQTRFGERLSDSARGTLATGGGLRYVEGVR